VPDTLIAGALRAPYGYLAVTAFFALGLMAKPSVVTLPFVLLLLDYWPLGRMQDRNTRGGLGTSVPSRVRGKRGSRGMDQDSGILFSQFRRVMLKHNLRPLRLLLLEKLPLLALAAVSCAVTVWAQGSALTANEKCSFGWRMRHIPVAYAGYLYQFFHPVGLAVPYPRPAELPPWQVLGSLAILVLVTAAAWAGRRRFPYLLVGWLWYLGMLLPAIGLVQFGVQATADRFTYLPQIGLGIALAWGLADLCRVPAAAFRRWALSAVAVLAVLALTACAWQQTTFWRDNQTLWTHALECTSNNVLAHVNLGNELTNQNQWADALLEYQRALKIDPRCAEALNNGGRATAALGRPGDAIPWYRKAIAADHTCAEAYWNLANLLAARGKPEDLEEAVERYGAAVRLRPEQADWQTGLAKAQNELGGALADAGRPAEAVRHYGAALQARPDFFDAHYNLGVALARLGQFGEAIGQLREALRLKPDDAEAHSSLGMALANTGRFGRAMAECQAALRIKPDSAATLGILAAIYAQAGRRSEALATFHKALELATRQKNQALANDLRAKLAALERQEPTGPSPPPPK
jgi:tetratricopeptide (TPR) repeat protein